MAQFKTVLVIEDNHDIRVSLRQVYEAAGFYVFTVTNGANALELLNIIPPPSLIICDVRMPLMDGVAFYRRKNEIPSLEKIPLIMMSAYQEELCKFPNVFCLPKPLDMFQLIEVSEKFVKDKGELINRR